MCSPGGLKNLNNQWGNNIALIWNSVRISCYNYQHISQLTPRVTIDDKVNLKSPLCLKHYAVWRSIWGKKTMLHVALRRHKTDMNDKFHAPASVYSGKSPLTGSKPIRTWFKYSFQIHPIVEWLRLAFYVKVSDRGLFEGTGSLDWSKQRNPSVKTTGR